MNDFSQRFVLFLQDFDAPHKQKRQLCDTDEQEENELLHVVFSLLRVGEFSRVRKLLTSIEMFFFFCISF